MTITLRPFGLGFAGLSSQAMPVGASTHAAQGRSLASNATDVAGGFLSQRWFLARNLGGTFSWFYAPSTPVRYLWCTLGVTSRASYAGTLNYATVTLQITDGTHTVTTSDVRMPRSWDGVTPLRPGSPGPERLGNLGVFEGWLDVTALATTLDRTVPWRVTATLTCQTGVAVEFLRMEEAPRWAVDTSESFGALVAPNFMPRAPITDTDAMTRVLASLEAGYGCGRTWFSYTSDEVSGFPLSTSATVTGPLAGWTSSGGGSLVTRVRPRRLRTAATNGSRWRARCRYRLTGAAGGDTATAQVVTGAGTFPVTLTDTTGSWVDGPVWSGYLATNLADPVDATFNSDTIALGAKVTNGTSVLQVDALTVWEWPE